MKKLRNLIGFCVVLAGFLFGSQLLALDTVVVGQPYYYGPVAPYYGGYGGYYPGPYGYGGYGGYAPYVYPPANPVFQAGAIGSNPYFLGSQMYLNGNAATRQQVRNNLQKASTIFLAPQLINDSGAYYPGYYGGAYYPY